MCEKEGIHNYPTLKFGYNGHLEEYHGGREKEELAEFIKDLLCGPKHLEHCDDEAKKKIEEYMKMPMADLTDKIEDQDEAEEHIDEEFDKTVKELQDEFLAAKKEKEETEEAIKNSGLDQMEKALDTLETARIAEEGDSESEL